MTKIAYNQCYGGFSLSDAACERYAELAGIKLIPYKGKVSIPGLYDNFSSRAIPRTDPLLIQVIEELDDKANGRCAQLGIHELHPGTKYRIDEYDGMERVMTIDSYEWETA